MFNPAYVLPTFLGVCCAGLVIWNVRMTGDVDKLDKKLETALDDNDEFEKKVEGLVQRNTFLASQILEQIRLRTETEYDLAAQAITLEQKDTTIKDYQQDVDTLREERRIQEQKIESCLAAEAEYIQTILDLERTVKDFTGMINTLNNKIPNRDESGKFKKKK